MSFLAPLFLAGAAAVALPFLFHLIRRSSREKIPFSSLMFLSPSPPRLTKRSRLEHLLLLLLRCAVIGLLALAFARPFVAKPTASAPLPAENRRVLVLLDASASMRRENLWELGREAALEILRSLSAADQGALFVFDRRARPVLTLAETSKMTPAEVAAAAETRLSGLTPSWGGTHLGASILSGVEHLVEALNRDSQEQGASYLKLVLITDLQDGAKLDGLQGFEWPNKLTMEVIPLEGRDLSNAGLQILPPQQKLFVHSSNAPVRVRVQNSAGSKVEKFTVQWQGPTGAVSEPAALYIPASQSKIVSAPPPSPGADRLVLSGDQISFDNTAWHITPETTPVVVAYAGSEAFNDPNESSFYVHRAFGLTNLAVTVQQLTAATLTNSPDLLILGKRAGPEASRLARTLLEEGRTVLAPLHDERSAELIAGLLQKPSFPVVQASVNNYAILGEVDFSHPLFAPFADARYSDFTKIRFWSYWKVDLSSITNAQVLARFDTGDPALVEIPSGRGRIFILASPWNPRHSQLALSTKFVPLLFAMLEQSAGWQETPRQFIVGDPLPLGEEPPSEITTPAGEKKPVNGEMFFETTTPGVYQAGNSQFAVNLDPAESRINPIPIQELQNLGLPLGKSVNSDAAAITPERRQHLLATDLENRQKLWRNFILAAIGFVLLETWMAGRLSRVPAAQPA